MSGGTLQLAWNAPAGATSYNIYRGSTPYFPLDTPLDTTVNTIWSESITPGENRFYVVRAVNGHGESADHIPAWCV